jgi:hypothetical protein
METKGKISQIDSKLSFSLNIGEGRLEVRGYGARSFIFMDFYNRCCCGYGGHNFAGTNIIRFQNAN